MGKILGITPQRFLSPLVYGLDRKASLFSTVEDIPAATALAFSEGKGDMAAAFLSPIDYARHGGDYCILPGISVSSEHPTGSILLYIGKNVTSIRSVAVDIRVTSEILLAKIIINERYRNPNDAEHQLQIIPMLPDPPAMLARADAALVASFDVQHPDSSNLFSIDLVEEWNDMTDLPYVYGFWVAKEDSLSKAETLSLIQAGAEGVNHMPDIIAAAAQRTMLPAETIQNYFSKFNFTIDDRVLESIEEFFKFCYYLKALNDVPDLNFYQSPE
jgi:chorismate dehydratase